MAGGHEYAEENYLTYKGPSGQTWARCTFILR
jgi:hypothetical protein